MMNFSFAFGCFRFVNFQSAVGRMCASFAHLGYTRVKTPDFASTERERSLSTQLAKTTLEYAVLQDAFYIRFKQLMLVFVYTLLYFTAVLWQADSTNIYETISAIERRVSPHRSKF